jgi:hypothetical protein
LNKVLDANKKAIFSKRDDGSSSTGYSYATWAQVGDIFKVEDKSFLISSQLDPDNLDRLFSFLKLAHKCFWHITSGKEAKRVHFIMPILIIVCAQVGEVEIMCEEDVNGEYLHAHGHFEVVLQRHNKRVCILEAKKDDLEQGTAQNLLGCEVLSEVECLPVVYGIVTNYLEWLFLRSSDDSIERELVTLNFEEGNIPTIRSVQVVANKICTLLSD